MNLLLFLILVSSVASIEPGVFFTNVNSPVYNSRENIRKALEEVADLGLKVVYPCIWNKNQLFYKSNAFNTHFKTELPSRDILQEFIDEASKLELKVVPWFEYGLKIVYRKGQYKNSLEMDPIAIKMRDKGWLTRNKYGNYNMDFKWGVEKAFLNPNHPEVKIFLKKLMVELCEYDVNGVLIDDHFSMKPGFGYDPYSNQLVHKHSHWLIKPVRKNLMTDSIARLLIELADTVQKAGKRFILSPAGDIGFSKNKWMQDWKKVVKSGKVDQLLLQNYRYDLAGFKTLLNSRSFQEAKSNTNLGVVLLTGLSNNDRVDGKLITQQTNYAIKSGITPSYFYYDTIKIAAKGIETQSERDRCLLALKTSLKSSYISQAETTESSTDLSFDDLNI